MDKLDRLGRDELFYKIGDREEESALTMLDNDDVNVNFQDKNGYSYLHLAAQSGCAEVIKKLLDKGADIDIRDKFGKTPLMVAISEYYPNLRNDRSIIDLFIENGADIEARTNSNIICKEFAKRRGLEL